MTRRPVHRTLAIRQFPPRHGQALVEFGIIAFVFTLLIAGILTFGLLLHGANVIQQAADVGAMEFSRFPYSPTGNFTNALKDSGLFEERYLFVRIGGSNPEDLPENYTPDDVSDLLQRMPLINRLLYPLYIYDKGIEDIDSDDDLTFNAIRYPGAVVTNDDGDETVLIPVVIERDSEGVETSLDWRKVVEEITATDQVEGPYSLGASAAELGGLAPGMVALRINYPYQSASMIAWQYRTRSAVPDENDLPIAFEDVAGADIEVSNRVTIASDANIEPPPGYSFYIPADSGIGPNAGSAGLGRVYAMSQTVRPFRRVLSAQGIYRREVFAP